MATASEQAARDLYFNTLGREPENNTVLNAWSSYIDQVGVQAAESAFREAAAPELAARSDEIAASMYERALGRAPESEAVIDAWSDYIENVGYRGAQNAFLQAAHPELDPQSETIARKFYKDVLDREPDSIENLKAWADHIEKVGIESARNNFAEAAQAELSGAAPAPAPVSGRETKATTQAIDPSQSTLSPNFADYVYRMLARGEQAANMPFQEYTGQRFAGPSPLQLRAFSGIANLADPAAFAEAQRFITMAGTPTQFTTGSGQPVGITSLPEVTGAHAARARGAVLPYDPEVTGAHAARARGAVLPTVKQELSRFGVTPGWIGQVPSTAIPTTQTLQGMFPEEAANFADGGDVTMTGASNTTTAAMPQTNPFQLGSVADYMSPYTGAVTDIAAREARRQADIGRTQEQARMAQAGAYGGSRQAIMEAERQRNLNTQIGDIATTGLQSAYDRALKQRTGEAELGLQAGQALGQLGVAQGQYGLNALNTMLNAGQVQQQIAQQPLDFGYQQWQESLAYPYQQGTYMSSMLGGLPLAANPYSPGGSALGGGISGLTSLLSLLAGITK